MEAAENEFEDPPAGAESPDSTLGLLDKMRRLEAVLYLSRKPIHSRKLAQLAELADGTQARTFTKQLNDHYDKIGRAFQIKQIAGGYQLMTRPQFASWLRRLEHLPPTTRLSAPAMETLSIVAYRQPLLKAEIEAIRGVSCGEMLRQLLESGLIKIAGRSEELGRPFFYATTKYFLRTFGLSDLQALPRAEELLGRGLPKPVLPQQNGSAEMEQLKRSESADPISNSKNQLEESHVSLAVSSTIELQTTEDAQDRFPPALMPDQENSSQDPTTAAVDDNEEWDDGDELEADDDLEDDEEWEDGDEEIDDDEIDDDEIDDDEIDDDELDDDELDDDELDDDEEWDDDDEEEDEDLEDHWEEVDDDDDELDDDDEGFEDDEEWEEDEELEDDEGSDDDDEEDWEDDDDDDEED